MTVTMYRNNKIDEAEQHDPDRLAEEFIETIRGEANPGYKTSGRLNLEFEYRWFLAGLGAPNHDGYTWDEGDWPPLWAALNFRLDGMDEDTYSAFLRSLGPRG
jgi:hypothetical protein